MEASSSILDGLSEPHLLRALPEGELQAVADAVRAEMIDAVSVTGGHLGSPSATAKPLPRWRAGTNDAFFHDARSV
ncbi:MAG: hypothetical protein K2Y56_06700, partial [Methylobacterium sp.]|nr:hypothetical protein [Methylobacterium sp.]